jgi:hypothetical protein
MSLYEKKLERLEELAGVMECAHSRLLIMPTPDWFIPEGHSASTLLKQCLDCRKVLAS